MTQKELLKNCLDILAEANASVFELKSREGKALAFLLDSALKYGTILYHDKDFIDGTVRFDKVEEEIYKEHLQNKKHILELIIK